MFLPQVLHHSDRRKISQTGYTLFPGASLQCFANNIDLLTSHSQTIEKKMRISHMLRYMRCILRLIGIGQTENMTADA